MLKKNFLFRILTFGALVKYNKLFIIKNKYSICSLEFAKKLIPHKTAHFNKEFVFFNLAFNSINFNKYYSTKIKTLAYVFWLSLPVYNKYKLNGKFVFS